MNRIDITLASTTTPGWLSHAHRPESQSVSGRQEVEPPTADEPVERNARLRDNSWPDVHSAAALTDLLFRIAHPVVVAFEDRDCTHCRAQRAMLSLAWHQLDWQVSTLRVDGRRLPDVADHYRILGYPTLLVFSAGQVVDRLPGRRDARSIMDRLSRLTSLSRMEEISRDRATLQPTEAATGASKSAR
ncbi:hypothetical protein Pve01_87670 [Planomonospora venezuelensis]|nr:hypothetical protein Pve01_87670 [Planomonospora venezuelensis]